MMTTVRVIAETLDQQYRRTKEKSYIKYIHGRHWQYRSLSSGGLTYRELARRQFVRSFEALGVEYQFNISDHTLNKHWWTNFSFAYSSYQEYWCYWSGSMRGVCYVTVQLFWIVLTMHQASSFPFIIRAVYYSHTRTRTRTSMLYRKWV